MKQDRRHRSKFRAKSKAGSQANPSQAEGQKTETGHGRAATASRGGILGAIAPVLLLLAVGVAIWFYVFRDSPDDRVDQLMAQAREAMELFEYTKAENLILEALQTMPESGLLHHNLAALYMRQGRHAEARQEFERAAALYGPQANEVKAEEYFQLAELDVREKKIDEAERHLRLAIEAHPTRELLHVRLIDLQLAFKHNPAAADSITMDFLRLCGRTPKNMHDAGFVHYRRRSYNSAIVLARAAATLLDSILVSPTPRIPSSFGSQASADTALAVASHKIVANSYWKSGRPDEGLAYLEEPLRRYPNAPDLWVAQASLYIGDSRYDAALESLDRATQLDPDHYDACVARMMALFNAARLEEALRQANLCLSLTDSEEEHEFLRTQMRRFREQLRQIEMGDQAPSTSPDVQEQP